MLSDKNGHIRNFARKCTLAGAVTAAVVNLVIGFVLGGEMLGWLVILVAEAIALAVLHRVFLARAKVALAPLDELERMAEQSKASALQAHDMHRLAKKLERVEEPGLAEQLSVAGSDNDMGVLLESLNHMLDRIDQRYQAQKRFTSDASHELRTPLAVIISYVDRLDRKGRDNPAIQENCISAIREAAELMRRLIEDLLLLARGDSKTQKLVLRQVDLSQLVEEHARQHGMVDETHRLITRVQEGVTITADTDLLRRCLWVLTENAQKYTPEGGEIRISLEADETQARITVADSGIGIAEADLPHVFERFYRSESSRDRNTGGSGLGLAIAKTIAGYHEGTLTVESKPGEGTAFTLSLPLQVKEKSE